MGPMLPRGSRNWQLISPHCPFGSISALRHAHSTYAWYSFSVIKEVHAWYKCKFISKVENSAQVLSTFCAQRNAHVATLTYFSIRLQISVAELPIALSIVSSIVQGIACSATIKIKICRASKIQQFSVAHLVYLSWYIFTCLQLP